MTVRRLSLSFAVSFGFVVCSLLTITADAAKPADPFDVIYDFVTTRTAPNGETHQLDVPEPLIWRWSDHLLKGTDHERFVESLNEFLALPQEKVDAYDDIRRAILQRHLWVVFDWATVRRPPTFEPEPKELRAARFRIQRKVAAVMKRLALPKTRIRALRNPMQAVASDGRYPEKWNAKDGYQPFFPPDLFDDGGPWVVVRRKRGGPPAELHTRIEHEFRTAFLVLIRLPGGRAETVGYLDRLNRVPAPVVFTETGMDIHPDTPQMPLGTQLALVERGVFISDEGEPVMSPLVYRAQFRAQMSYKADDLETFQRRNQAYAEFILQPRRMMRGESAVRAIEPDERVLSMVEVEDPFAHGTPAERRRGRDRIRSCFACHARHGVLSFHTRNRDLINNEGLPAQLVESTADQIAISTVVGKKQHYTWGVLEALWRDDASE